MAGNLFVNLGRNLVRDDGTGIMAEALAIFGGRQVYVLALQGDRLLNEVTLPEGVVVVEVCEDGTPVNPPAVAAEDVFILNGGVTPQQACMLVHLTAGCTIGKVVNMQREMCVEIAPRRAKKLMLVDRGDRGYICAARGGWEFTWLPTTMQADELYGDGGVSREEAETFLRDRINHPGRR